MLKVAASLKDTATFFLAIDKYVNLITIMEK